MSGNPRKFSEKIALHTQKQAEETAAFEQIMKEVQSVGSSRPSPGGNTTAPKPIKSTQQQQNLMPMTGMSMNCRSLPNVHQMSSHQDKGSQGHFSTKMSPRASRGSSIGPVKTQRSRTDHSPYASPPSLTMLSSSMGTGNSSSSNIHAQMMYQNASYLSPPSDASWRRANSDSALHSLIIPSVVPDSSEESSNNSNDPRDNYGYGGVSHFPNHNEPQPVIPHTVGDGSSLLEIPPSNSTGSLPDLTNFQFTPPLQQPIDPDDSQVTNSPYSTSPLSATYSPTGGSPNPPPPHSNSGAHPPQPGINNQQRSPHGPPLHQQHLPQQHPSQPQQSNISQQSNQSQQQSVLDNSISLNNSSSAFPNFNQNDNMLTAYRCPPRPSPQNSPSPFRSPSPLDGQLSAPPSPGTGAAGPPLQNSADSYYLSQQANALQQHFEQISVGGTMVNNSPFFYNTGQIQTGATTGITQHSPQHGQPQTPQTPTSIPDIIFTDFSDGRTGEPFDDLLASEAAAQVLREGLGSLDMDGFNMLADPDLVPLDPQAEDSFRLDRL